MRAIHYAGLLAVSLSWGSTFLFIKVLTDDMGPLLVVAGRQIFALPVLLIWVGVARPPFPRGGRTWLGLVGTAVTGNLLPLMLISWAVHHIPAATTSILTSTAPLFTAALAVWLLPDELLKPTSAAGLLLGFAGIALLTGGEVSGGLGLWELLAELAALGAGVSYALNAIVARLTLRAVDPMSLATSQFALVLLFLVPLILLFDQPTKLGSLGPGDWLAWVMLGLTGGALAYVAFFWLLRAIGAIRTAPTGYLIPAVGAVLGWVILGEAIHPTSIAGLLLVVSGLALVSGAVRMGQRREPVVATADAPRERSHP